MLCCDMKMHANRETNGFLKMMVEFANKLARRTFTKKPEERNNIKRKNVGRMAFLNIAGQSSTNSKFGGER